MIDVYVDVMYVRNLLLLSSKNIHRQYFIHFVSNGRFVVMHVSLFFWRSYMKIKLVVVNNLDVFKQLLDTHFSVERQ